MVVFDNKGKNLARRFYANAIDYAIFIALMIFYIILVGEPNENGGAKVTGVKALLIPFLWMVYFPFTESLLGQSLGKRAFHLHIVDLHGASPHFFQLFFRRVLDIFEMMSFGVMAILVIRYSEKNQRVGDMIAGTTVVRTDAVCRFCSIELELTPKEVFVGVFRCPKCGAMN
jgi:uncharacterized RDD family membrane protein YckC